MPRTQTKPASRKLKQVDSPTLIKQVRARTARPHANPIPAPDNGSHAHSAAAHLGDAHGHTKPLGNPHPSAAPGALRQPPMEISRAGKQHR